MTATTAGPASGPDPAGEPDSADATPASADIEPGSDGQPGEPEPETPRASPARPPPDRRHRRAASTTCWRPSGFYAPSLRPGGQHSRRASSLKGTHRCDRNPAVGRRHRPRLRSSHHRRHQPADRDRCRHQQWPRHPADHGPARTPAAARTTTGSVPRSSPPACGPAAPSPSPCFRRSCPGTPSSLDLAIAVAVLIAASAAPPASAEGCVLVAELGPDGSLRPVRGVLPAVLAAAAAGHTRAVVAPENAAEAAMVPGVTVISCRSLQEVRTWLRGSPLPASTSRPPDPRRRHRASRRLIRWPVSPSARQCASRWK